MVIWNKETSTLISKVILRWSFSRVLKLIASNGNSPKGEKGFRYLRVFKTAEDRKRYLNKNKRMLSKAKEPRSYSFIYVGVKQSFPLRQNLTTWTSTRHLCYYLNGSSHKVGRGQKTIRDDQRWEVILFLIVFKNLSTSIIKNNIMFYLYTTITCVIFHLKRAKKV